MAKKPNDPLAAAGVPAEVTDPVLANSLAVAAASSIAAQTATGETTTLPPPGVPSSEPAEAPAGEPVLPPLAEAPPTVRAPIFVAQRPIVLSWGPGFIRLAAGDEVSEDSYGDGAIERMIQSGAALVPKE